MLEKKYLLLIILFFICSYLTAQQNQVINGLIIIDFKDENPENVIVTNKQAHNSVKSDLAGRFSIKASVGDTLLFRGDFLENRKLVVIKRYFDLDPLIVHMNEEVVKLKEIIIRPPLTGDMEKDIKSVKKREEIEKVYANLGIDIKTLDLEPKENIGDVIPGAFPVVLNLEATVKYITGYYRRMKNLRDYEAYEKKMTTVKNYFGDDYFNQIIGIKKSDILQFLLFIEGKANSGFDLYYQQKDFFSLDKIMRENAIEFQDRLKDRETGLIKN